MALRFLDSFDHYTPAQVDTKWTSTLFVRRDVGLHGYAMAGNMKKGMLFPTTTVIMECYINGGPGGGVFALYDDGRNASTVETQQINLDVTNEGAVRVSRWGGDTPLIAQTAPDLVRNGAWAHIGWRVLVHPTAGTVEVRLNGETVINVSGVQTTCGLTPGDEFWSGTIGEFGLGDNANSILFDDLVVMDDVADGIADPRLPGGGGFTQFLGPVTIKVKRPNGAGSVAGWTGVPTSPNWANVDDIESDDDATYNVATVAQTGASDLFAMEDLLPGEDVLAVQSCVLARKTDDGIAAIAKLTNDGTTVRAGATVYQPGSYAYMHAPEPTAPDGSLWTAAKWNAIQYGYKRIV